MRMPGFTAQSALSLGGSYRERVRIAAGSTAGVQMAGGPSCDCFKVVQPFGNFCVPTGDPCGPDLYPSCYMTETGDCGCACVVSARAWQLEA